MNNDEQELEPTLDVETSPMMEPISEMVCKLPTAGTSPPKYWQAQNLASALHKEFEELKKKGDIKEMRSRFFILARYYGRTMGILRQALTSGNGDLINAALRNLITLHQPLHHMHEVSPTGVPFVITLDRDMRRRLVDDLVIQVLVESPEPLPLETITSQVNDLHFMANAKDDIISTHLDNLIDGGHVQRAGDGFTQTKRTYNSINIDHSSLQALLGEKLYSEFEKGGFPGLSNIVDRKESFKKFFHRFTNCGTDMAEMFIAASIELFGTPSETPETSPWNHSNLIGSLIPRPYQYDAFAIFRGYGYKGQVIESPSGSGKTMIGMMCIQDWLRALSPGMSILVLVPTVNYEQQWVSELCYKPIGLHVTPDIVFTGTPAELEEERKRSGISPAILVMTYTALAQLGSPAGKGGFDKISVERFLQGNNIQYVILDEVHKVVENLKSVSAMVTQLLTEWLEDGSLSGLIGFSGTAAAYRDRFDTLGLQLAYTMPSADLIAYGFVAPFAEYGVPFTYSDREKNAIDLLKEYKSHLIEYVDILGIESLKRSFANIPLEKRIVIGKNILWHYSGRKDQDSALEKRYTEWEQGRKFTLNELPIIPMIQIAEDLSDKDLLERTIIDLTDEEKEKKRRDLQDLIIKIDKIREELKGLIYFPDLTTRLNADNFGSTFNAEKILDLSVQNKKTSRSVFKELVKDELAFSIVGLYSSLKNLYYRLGEGRVDSIRSIISAEQSSRKVSGVIIFDSAKRIRWKSDTAVPGYAGVGGLFAQMLGDDRLIPMAAISSEIYLPWSENNPLTHRISEYIRKEIMLNELGNTFFNLVTQKSGSEEQLSSLKVSFDALLKEYIGNLINVGASRPSEFNRKVIKKFQRLVKGYESVINVKKIINKLSLKHHHVRMWVDNFFDYALIASRFHEARTAKLLQAGGTEQKFFVVKMASGERKQLMYELISRVVDAESLPINVIIVSTWARTGWNVISPNILIDGTATRNVTAWQQLRGRAMRASLTWDRDCYELVMILLGSHLRGIEDAAGKLPPDVFEMEEFNQKHKVRRKLNDKQKELILEAHQFARSLEDQEEDMVSEEILVDKIINGRLSKLKGKEKELLAAELMISRNKVTHIYELVKAYGSAPQVRLDRTSKTWHRNEAIAAKHLHEYSINPDTGLYGSGEGHAPLIYVDDPRKNVPSQLRDLMKKELKGRDPVIVNGWIKAVVSGVDEDKTIT